MSSIIPNNALWNDFFNCFENLPSLWKLRDDMVFKDKELKKQSWDILLENYKAIDPNASLDDVKKKVLGIKSCYRRELKKVRSSEIHHVPSLWYFDQLHFLADHVQQTNELSPMELLYHNELSREEIEPQRKKIKSETYLGSEENEHLRVAIENVMGPRKEDVPQDEADIYGKSWAASYRKLSNWQQICAKKAIEDILILGQLDQLTLNMVQQPAPCQATASISTPIFKRSPYSDDEND
ncbi:uncharacterized protein LOC129906824 [Episyrphus balteatus]|uniref:uncharacterized protein LOC129906824 n=1 Tax=Episyrphus balteatus TaxID=286459 RepID=UPI0024869EAA|nr:uncharacterized protein LOC129906824 [Episyrphus balteatus]